MYQDNALNLLQAQECRRKNTPLRLQGTVTHLDDIDIPPRIATDDKQTWLICAQDQDTTWQVGVADILTQCYPSNRCYVTETYLKITTRREIWDPGSTFEIIGDVTDT